MSANLYDTFGNEVEYKITQDTMVQYLKDATIKFVLPEASSEIVGGLVKPESVNPVELDMVKSKLISLGFGEPNALALSAVLVKLAKDQGISPLDYFKDSSLSLKLAIDTYKTINMLRPPGNRIGLAKKKTNSKSRYKSLIKP